MSENCPHAGKIASPGAAFFHYTPSGVNAGKIAIHNLFAAAVVVDDLRAICQLSDSYRPDPFLTALPALRGFVLVLVLVIFVLVFLAIIIVVGTLSLPSVIATLTVVIVVASLTVVIVVATFSVIAAIIAFSVIATTASLSVIAIFGVCVGWNQ